MFNNKDHLRQEPVYYTIITTVAYITEPIFTRLDRQLRWICYHHNNNIIFIFKVT